MVMPVYVSGRPTPLSGFLSIVVSYLFYSFDHILQYRDMFVESFFSRSCYGISSIRLLADKAFMYFNKTIFLEVHEVSSQVAIGHFKHLLQVIEVHSLVHHQDAHHPEANTALKNLI